MQGPHFIFNNAGSVREACTAGYKTEFALQAAVVAAIAVAVAGNTTFFCNVSVTGYGQQDIQNVTRALVANGFGVSLNGSTLTINW